MKKVQFRRARRMDELLEDKGFPYHVGQLIGASEMIAHWMRMSPDGDTKEMGEKLAEVSGWFFKQSSAPASRSEEDTMIMKRQT